MVGFNYDEIKRALFIFNYTRYIIIFYLSGYDTLINALFQFVNRTVTINQVYIYKHIKWKERFNNVYSVDNKDKIESIGYNN